MCPVYVVSCLFTLGNSARGESDTIPICSRIGNVFSMVPDKVRSAPPFICYQEV